MQLLLLNIATKHIVSLPVVVEVSLPVIVGVSLPVIVGVSLPVIVGVSLPLIDGVSVPVIVDFRAVLAYIPLFCVNFVLVLFT